MHRFAARCLAGSLVFAVACAHAQEQASTYQSEYLERLKSYEAVQPMGDTPFGETIDLATGQVTFAQTDIVLEGTGPTIRVSRSRGTTGSKPWGVAPEQVLGDWSLEIPRISSLVPAPRNVDDGGVPGHNWRNTAVIDTASLARCSSFGYMWQGQGGIPLEEWWHGYDLVLSDGAAQPLLKRDPGYTAKPATGDAYPIVTLSDVQVRCLSSTKNGQDGEAFLAVAPDGTKYWFDWLVGIKADKVRKHTSDPSSLAATVTPMVPMDGGYIEQNRMHAAMYVTRIEDRFGNFVTYHYDPAAPRRLLSIVASDGRKVAFGWNGDRLISATAQPDTPADARTWRYEYAGMKLGAVVLPDDSRWTFDIRRTGEGALPDMFASSCTKRHHANPTPTDTPEVSTITAPSGLVGTFAMRHRWHARSYANSACLSLPGGGEYESVPPLFENLSLVERTLSGPGLSKQTWTYAYGPASASARYDACAVAKTCADTAWVDVVEPGGARTRYTHSTRDGVMEAKPVRTDTYDHGGALLRSEATSYPDLASLPFHARLGDSLRGARTNTERLEHRHPTTHRVITQQGREFHWYVPATCGAASNKPCLDVFGRPTKTVKHSRQAP